MMMAVVHFILAHAITIKDTQQYVNSERVCILSSLNLITINMNIERHVSITYSYTRQSQQSTVNSHRIPLIFKELLDMDMDSKYHFSFNNFSIYLRYTGQARDGTGY